MTHLNVWGEKYSAERPRRLLALDGGGILGIITLEILKEIESQLAEETGQGASFRLGDYFDYIAGTSTGAIISTGLAVGMSVDELTEFYVNSGSKMFTKQWLLRRARALYEADPLREELQKVLLNDQDVDRTLGSEDLRCLLLVVTRNATTDSPWPVSNNPFAKYNDRVGYADRNNLDIRLWELVRASTAAPVYFPPESLEMDKDMSFTFVDGGVTPYNNPAFLLYRMATLPHYRLNWPKGEENLMLVSVGTGSAAKVELDLDERGELIPKNAAAMPGVLMGGSAVDQDINCRAFGRCLFGDVIDRELGDMKPREGDPVTGAEVPRETPTDKDFLYARYNPDVSRAGLDALGLPDISERNVQAMDKVEFLDDMRKVGKAYAQKHVDMSVFSHFGSD